MHRSQGHGQVWHFHWLYVRAARPLIAFYTSTDASLAIIPLTIFWKLHMRILQRIQLCIVFSLNIPTSTCSGVKTQYLAELGNRTDQTRATYDIFAWVTAEFLLLVVCGMVPTLHLLLQGIQSLLSLIRRKVAPRPVLNEHQSKHSDEVLTIGKIRTRLRRQAMETTTNESGGAAQLNSRME